MAPILNPDTQDITSLSLVILCQQADSKKLQAKYLPSRLSVMFPFGKLDELVLCHPDGLEYGDPCSLPPPSFVGSEDKEGPEDFLSIIFTLHQRWVTLP